MSSYDGFGTPSRVLRIATCSSLLAILGAGCSAGGLGSNDQSNAQGSQAGNGSTAGSGGAGGSGNAGSGNGGGGNGGAGTSGSGGSGRSGSGGTGISGSGGSGNGGTGTSGSGGSGESGTGGAGISGSGGSGESGTGGSGAGGSGGGPIPHGACLDGITDYGKDGPFMMKTSKTGAINFYAPSVPAGCKVPVVHLANGTGATCSVYQPALQRLATHGFLTTCYESTNTGAGDQGLQALDAALMAYPDMADNKFGSTGHSQGGQAAFTVMALAEKKYGDKMIYAGLAMEPASGFGTQPTGATWQQLYAGLKSPMFMFSGLNTDGLVSQGWVQQAYDATAKTEEAYFWTANGATHIPVPNGEEEEISIPWFRWKLLGDPAACTFFKAIPMTDTKWAQVAAKNSAACQ